MGRPELGAKLTCASCSVRFYDLNRADALCPKCGAAQPAPKPRSYTKPVSSPGWRSRRQPVPVAAIPEDANAVLEPEVDGGEDAAEADEDAAEADEEPEAEVESVDER